MASLEANLVNFTSGAGVRHWRFGRLQNTAIDDQATVAQKRGSFRPDCRRSGPVGDRLGSTQSCRSRFRSACPKADVRYASSHLEPQPGAGRIRSFGHEAQRSDKSGEQRF